MKWVSALSTRASLEAAIREVVEQAQGQLQDQADLAIVFISSAFASEFSRLMPLLQEQLETQLQRQFPDQPEARSLPALIGCSGGGVVGVSSVGAAQEVENAAAISLTLAKLPGVRVQPFYRSTEELPDLDSPPNTWVDFLGVSPQDNPQFVLLADPMSAGLNELLQGLDFAYPDAAKVGGLASSPSFSTSGSLFCNFQHHKEGIVGVALSGNLVLDTIVAQGCRPIGLPYRVVEGDRNIILRLEAQTGSDISQDADIKTPLEILQQMFREELSEADRELVQRALFVGMAQSEFKATLEPGDFLIRNVLGVDPRNGAMAIADRVRAGQRIQFHLRDAKASAQDLTTLLERYQTDISDRTIGDRTIGDRTIGDRTIGDRTTAPPAGALIFACLGRGEGLYQEPNFDSRLFNQYLKQVPLSGFFCNGEIGPVGGTTYLHGYTSVFGICRPTTAG